MSKWRLAVGVGGVAVIGATLLLAYTKHVSWLPWSKTAEEIQSGVAHEVLVMHTKGGLLEVSRITATEQFDKKFIYSVLGMKLGETVAHIRVPAVYRYHIELAPTWEVYRKRDEFKVVTPPVRPSLPVAVDFGKMEKDIGGTWYLVVFNDQQDLDALEHEITAKLAQKAKSDVYLGLQRDAARKTVTEFVAKWLVTQQAWKAAEKPRIEVVFGE